jgi:Fe-S oxidoreductase
MKLLLGRMPVGRNVTPKAREEMERIDSCINCRHCADHCPYGLDTPALLRENLAFYRAFVKSL